MYFSRRYVPKKLVFYTCESRLSWRFSRNFDLQNSKSIPPRVFEIFTRGFRRYKGVDIAKKTLGADF